MRIKQLTAMISLLIAFLASASPALAATLSLSPASGIFGRTCVFTVDVLIDTQGVETDGADVILLYNPLTITAAKVTNGTVYSDFPGNTIDNGTGKVSIYALAPSEKGYTGKGTLAKVDFTVSASASASLATLRIDFDQNNVAKTTDSNVIQKSDLKDVLSTVFFGDYTIDSATTGCKAAAASVPPIGGGDLPQSGIWEVTWMAGGLGIFLILLSVLGFQFSDRSSSVFRGSVTDKQKTDKPNSEN